MTSLRLLAPTFTLALLALAVNARAQEPAAESPAADAPPPGESLAPTGSGTAGRIPKWTTSTALGNSVITESSGKIGVNVSPAAKLHVYGPQPPPLATNGIKGIPLLLTAGGKGSDTTGTGGQTAGAGAGILLYAGPGGDAPLGSYGGQGGSITLQPGTPGTSPIGYSQVGYVLLAPNGVGKVGVGTINPTYRLHVEGGAGTAVFGKSSAGYGVLGSSTGGRGVSGSSSTGFGVFGSSPGGYAGYFEGKARVTGNLEVGSCTGCTIFSDRGLKEHVSAVDPRAVLDKLAALPIREWNYKSDSPSVRHVGPMAQDFRWAFQLGADDKHIDMVDASGVTMASVQALYQLMLEKDRQMERQMRLNEQQGRRIARLEARLEQVRRAVRRKGVGKR
jgi:hypothetical protein